ncbi:hypothetical protein [Alloacidobacterium sp.]|uniref:hypothetical protein n=1 Tax=Alloacidobacterium sp. TaxID=2951999 RepID=UPI002D75E78B|nr:hypothetical protein [Alloacidobacterium sp.]HYK35072.1 hypothetical protein [Alloacidobacterium sp.]
MAINTKRELAAFLNRNAADVFVPVHRVRVDEARPAKNTDRSLARNPGWTVPKSYRLTSGLAASFLSRSRTSRSASTPFSSSPQRCSAHVESPLDMSVFKIGFKEVPHLRKTIRTAQKTISSCREVSEEQVPLTISEEAIV